MYSVKRGNILQLSALLYLISGNLLFSIIIQSYHINLSLATNLLVSQIGFIGLIIAVYLALTKSPVIPSLHIKKISLIDGLLCVGIAFTIMPLLNFINVASQFIVTNQIQEAVSQSLNYPLIVSLFLMAVLPAFLEELLTRSLIISNYRKQTVLITCLISGLFFGIFHLNVNQFLYAFVMGIVMCYIVMITESVVSSMIIHFTINASGIILLYTVNYVISFFSENEAIMNELMSESTLSNSDLLITLGVVFSVAIVLTPIALLFISILLKRHNKSFKGSFKLPTDVFMGLNKQNSFHTFKEGIDSALQIPSTEIPVVEKEKIITVPLIITILIFIVFVILNEFMTY